MDKKYKYRHKPKAKKKTKYIQLSLFKLLGVMNKLSTMVCPQF